MGNSRNIIIKKAERRVTRIRPKPIPKATGKVIMNPFGIASEQ